MTWTYDGDPSANDRDEVRFLSGDTDTTDQLVTDAEIAYAIDQESNNLLAAAKIAKAIMAKFARLVDKSVGDLKLSYSQRLTAYKELIDQLTERGTESAGTPYSGGISITDKNNREEDTDRVDPSFRRDLHSIDEHYDDEDIKGCR